MRRRQGGATAVEFALVLLLLLMFLLGLVDFARMMFSWNAASEASRAGARYAAICMTPATSKTRVTTIMKGYLPQIEEASVNLTWGPDISGAACDPTNCEWVQLKLSPLNFQWISPIPGLGRLSAALMPDFTTTLPREAMRQDVNSAALCN